MTDSIPQGDEHANCDGHVKLDVIMTAFGPTVVIHAQITLPRTIAWIPNDTYCDSEGELTARQISDGFFLTSERVHGRQQLHIVLTEALQGFGRSYDQEIHGLIIEHAEEVALMMQMTKAYLSDDTPDPVPGPAAICFNRNVERLLTFIGPFLMEKPLGDGDPDKALRRDYFLLGEVRPYVER